MCENGCILKQMVKPFTKINRQDHIYAFEKRKAGVLVLCGDKILLTQSYNKFWGIPKGHVEPFDVSVKECAERELREETGLEVVLKDEDLYRIPMGNCYIYKICLDSMDMVNLDNLLYLDSSGIGWVNYNCAFKLNLNQLTRKLLIDLDTDSLEPNISDSDGLRPS